MTLPRPLSDLLIYCASRSVSPSAPVLLTFSEPARSTRVSLLVLVDPVKVFTWEISMMRMECERLLSYCLI